MRRGELIQPRGVRPFHIRTRAIVGLSQRGRSGSADRSGRTTALDVWHPRALRMDSDDRAVVDRRSSDEADDGPRRVARSGSGVPACRERERL